MKITTSFLHLEHTPALDEKIFEASAKLEKFFHDKGNLKWSCYVKSGQHYAEIYYHAPSCEYHATAFSDSLYHSIDLVLEKIEIQITKKKDKYNKMHRKQQDVMILDPETAWLDHEDDEVA